MGDGEVQRLLGDDELPEPGPDYADRLVKDQYGLVYRCGFTQGQGWAWVTRSDVG